MKLIKTAVFTAIIAFSHLQCKAHPATLPVKGSKGAANSTTYQNKNSVPKKSKTYYRLEDFGGQAYYKPLDGRFEDGVQYPLITVTPFSADKNILSGTKLTGTKFSKITAQTNGTVFTKADVGKTFCGLFMHKNPSQTPRNAVDAFYPQEIASRYAKVVALIDGQNILVDFEFNGGNRKSPQVVQSGKGYIFHDNSKAWNKLRKAHTAEDNKTSEVRLAPRASLGNFVQSCYVIPQYKTWVVNPNIPVKIWSAKAQLARLKIGYEDYYKHEKMLGERSLKQSKFLFNLGNIKHHDLTFHGEIVPPHRRILESDTWRGVLVAGRKTTGITAFVGCNQLLEEEAIKAGKGLTEETFISFSGSAVSAGGTTKGDGLAEEVDEFGYVLFKDYVQRGQLFTQMNATYGGGNYLVVENADLYFNPQKAVNPPSQKLKVRVNNSKNAYDGFPQPIINHKSNYLPFVFQIKGEGNFFKIMSLGGSNRLSVFSIKGSNSVYTFLLNHNGIRKDNPGELRDYWDMCYTPKSNRWNFGEEKKTTTLPGRTANKLIPIEDIPKKGKRYVISRHYKVNEAFKELIKNDNAKIATVNKNGKSAKRNAKEGEMYSNAVRTAVCWSTVLNKYGDDINPEKDVPKNGLPLALQPGDQFIIPAYKGSTHDPNKVYTVARKERASFPEYPAEFVAVKSRKNWPRNYSNAQSYRFFWCGLDKDLPASIGITFEIEMVKSGAEELLDGKARTAFQTYKGVGRIGENGKMSPNEKTAKGKAGYTVSQKFNSKQFKSGEPHGHICYSQAELTEWYKNVNWNNGFYRENSNKGRGFKKFEITNQKGNKVKVNPLARYSKGKVFINCTGGPKGQYSNKLDDFVMRELISKELGIKNDAKFWVYSSEEVRQKGVKGAKRFVVKATSESQVPPMPEPCRKLLNSLPH